jgi:hypothetical protein
MAFPMEEFIPESIQKSINEIGEQVSEGLYQIYQEMLADTEKDLQTIEEAIRALMRGIGLSSIEAIVGQYDRHHRKGARPCPTCGKKHQWKRYEARQCISTLGEFMIDRAYYYCSDCRGGWCPLDERLGLGRSELSPVAEQIASYAGAFMPFATAADFLARSHLLNISHDSVNRATVRVGASLRQEQNELVEVVEAGEFAYPSGPQALPETLYVSADGVRYLTTDGTGRELKVAVVYETELRHNAQGNVEPQTLRPDYVVSSQAPDDFRVVVDVLAQQRGVLQAPRTAVVQDGAPWRWDHIAPLAGPERTEIIDFYHTAGYISAAIDTLLPSEQHAFWKHLLLNHLKQDDQGLEHLTQVLLCLSVALPERPRDVQAALDYLERYGTRMHYARYREQRLQIGSGTVESAANRLVSARLKQAGMRWNPVHAEAVAQVRAAILSQHRWDDFWQTYRPVPRTYRRKQPFAHAA